MYHVVGVDLLPHHQQKPLIRRARFWASFCVQSLKFDRHPFITLRKVVQVAKTNSYRKGAAFLVTRQPVSLSPELQILWRRSHLRLHICSRPCSGLTDLETIEQGTSKKPPRSCFRKCCRAGDWYTIDHHSPEGRPLFLHQRKRTPRSRRLLCQKPWWWPHQGVFRQRQVWVQLRTLSRNPSIKSWLWK